MKLLFFISISVFSTVLATPLQQRQIRPPSSFTNCSIPVTLTGNPFATRTLFPNIKYQSKVTSAAATITDPVLKAKALKVGNIGTFVDLNGIFHLQNVVDNIKEIPCSDAIMGLSIHGIPKPYCGPLPNPAPFGDKEEREYFTLITNEISAVMSSPSQDPYTAFAIILEPGAVASLVLANSSCVNHEVNVKSTLITALKKYNLPNVAVYIDAGHGGLLGWNKTLYAAANLIADLYISAGSPASFRGFATNVGSYNAFKMSPGEFATPFEGPINRGMDESHYISALVAILAKLNVPNNSIMDTSRNAVQGLRSQWTNWCNINGVGMGVRPTAVTGEGTVDAFVWANNPGVSDGGSEIGAAGFDVECAKEDSFKPAPAAGVWNQAYFEMLVENARPMF